MGKLTDKKIAFLIAPKDFRDEEYFRPKVALQAEGAQIFTFAKGDPEEVTGSSNGKAHTTVKFDEVTPGTFDCLIIVGGKGVKKYFNDKSIHALVRSFYESDKLIAAICSGPVVLANAGILKGKKVTSWIKEKEVLVAVGAKWQNQTTVIDGNLITSQGPETAMEFGIKIGEMLG